MAAVTWEGAASLTSGISGVTINTGAGNLGSEIDNTTNLDRFLDVELSWQHGTGPTANSPWYVYILYAMDGTNYEDGGTSTQPTKVPAATFPAPNDTSAHKAARVNVPLAPFKFKLLVWNGTNQNSSSSAVTLLAKSHNELLP